MIETRHAVNLITDYEPKPGDVGVVDRFLDAGLSIERSRARP
jgi:hypothetical protein